MRRERCGRIDDGARTDDEDDAGARRGGFGFTPGCRWKRFAEPDDVGSKASAAFVIDFLERHSRSAERAACVAARTAYLAQIPVKLQDVARTGAQVKRIDVLRRKGEVADRFFEPRERVVAGIGFGALMRGFALVIPRPNEPGSRANPCGDASSSTRCVRQRPPTPRNVGRPLSAEMPDPVKTRTDVASRNARRRESSSIF